MIDETFIVASGFIAFFLVIAYFRKPIGNALTSVLDGRAQRIEAELSDAIRLREQAQVMLSNYEKKYREIETEAQQLMDDAKKAADRIRKEAQRDVERTVSERIKAAEKRIQQSEELAVQGVQEQAVTRALVASEDIIRQHLHDDADERLMHAGLQDLQRIAS